jgi:alanine-glyoxylate transaminase/serine-glyoxylate transaminase/serine-pyruvate transaminase
MPEEEITMTHRAGRHFLQIPGPTNVPERVLRAMDRATIDHRGPAFGRLAQEVLEGLGPIFGTRGPVVIYAASGTGAWEAALVNTLSPGDRVLMCDTGHFATLWRNLATRLGLEVELVPGDWRQGTDAGDIERVLADDSDRRIRAVCVVHNETSTGTTARVPLIRAVMDALRHPALLMVDTISSLGSMEYLHDDWGVDVTIAGSQKGLMLPPGLSFNAVGEKALAASATARLARTYWSWEDMIAANRDGWFPYTPATNLLFGLREAIAMLMEEGLRNVFRRHARHAEATRRAVRAWGLEIVCADAAKYSNTLTGVLVPAGHDADRVRRLILQHFDMSLGTGLGKLAGKAFRIGHLGDFNDLTLAGTLAGVEMGLEAAGVPIRKEGVRAAMDFMVATRDERAS